MDTLGGGTTTNFSGAGSSVTLSNGTVLTLRTDGRLNVNTLYSGPIQFDYLVSDGQTADQGTVNLNVVPQSDETTARSVGFVTTWIQRVTAQTIFSPLIHKGTQATTSFSGAMVTSTVTGATNPSKTYGSAGTYTVTVVGPMGGLGFNGSAAISELMSVERWGNMAFTTMGSSVLQRDQRSTQRRRCTGLAERYEHEQYVSKCDQHRKCIAQCMGHIHVTSLSGTFMDNTTFNGNVTGWNTANVTNMSHMLRNTNAFNQNIGTWNVGNVTDMQLTFYEADGFNQSLNSWNTAKVTNMNNMFGYADSLMATFPVGNTGLVTNMAEMFRDTLQFNQSIGSWNTGNVTNLYATFHRLMHLTNPSVLDTSKVTNLQHTFSYANSFNGNLSGWNTGLVTNMAETFRDNPVFNQALNSWNTASATNSTPCSGMLTRLTRISTTGTLPTSRRCPTCSVKAKPLTAA